MAILLVLAALFTADKGPEPAKKTPPKADIRGAVTNLSVTKAKRFVGVMQVAGKKEKDTQHARAVVRFTSTTKFYKWVDGKKKEAKVTDIKKGTKVQCVFIGPVAESYPVQAKAGEVLILDDPKK